MELIFSIEQQERKAHQRKGASDVQKGMLERFKTCPSIIIPKTRQTS